MRQHTEYTYEHHTGDVFNLPFEVETDPEFISITDTRAVLAFLVHDDNPADPFEEFDEGDFFQFDGRRKHDARRPDLDEWKRIIRANPGRVVTVDAYGDGFKAGHLVLPADCRGKRHTGGEECRAAELLDDMDGYYIVPEDATDKAKYADAQIEQYSDWCNGEVYGVVVWTYERENADDEWSDAARDECWGYYGEDYAREELRELFDATVKGEVPRHDIHHD